MEYYIHKNIFILQILFVKFTINKYYVKFFKNINMKYIITFFCFQLLFFVEVNTICIAQTNCITCQSNTTSIATGSGAVSFGGNNSSIGSRSTTFGFSNTASGTNSLAFGQMNQAAGLNSFAAGKSTVTTSNAYYSLAFGYNAKSSGFNSYVFGTGTDEDVANQINFSYLENNINNSFLIGFNSYPSFFVKGSNSPQTSNDSKVGIGTFNPLQSLDIYGAIKIGNTSNSYTGTIRWTGLDFEGYTGTSWKSFTSTSGWSLSENNTLYNSGNVGINTNSPQQKLDVVIPANNFVSFGSSYLNSGDFSGIQFGYRQDNLLYRKSAIVFEKTTGSKGKIHLLNDIEVNNESASIEDAKLTISDNGYVGIGNTNPLTNLQVGSDLVLINNSSDIIGNNIYFDNSTGKYKRINNGVSNKITFEPAGGFKFNTSAYGTSNSEFSAWMPVVVINEYGQMGIGTTNLFDYKLAIDGKMIATEIKVKNSNSWPDYVFKENYDLMSLKDLEKFIKINNHLPKIQPSEIVEQTNEIDLGKMNVLLLEKVEELTLYLIQQQKEIDLLKSSIQNISKK